MTTSGHSAERRGGLPFGPSPVAGAIASSALGVLGFWALLLMLSA